VLPGGVLPPALLEQPFEPMDVDLLGVDLEHITSAPRLKDLLRFERLSQPRDLDVEAVPSGAGRPRGP
jgi:hypothetical protein